MKSILKKIFGMLLRKMLGDSYKPHKYYKKEKYYKYPRPKYKKGFKGLIKKFVD